MSRTQAAGEGDAASNRGPVFLMRKGTTRRGEARRGELSASSSFSWSCRERLVLTDCTGGSSLAGRGEGGWQVARMKWCCGSGNFYKVVGTPVESVEYARCSVRSNNDGT